MNFDKYIKYLFLFISLLYYFSGFSQTGGSHTYDFLNLTNSARVAALGGNNISLNDGDLNLSFHNPALLTPEMDKNLVLNYVLYYAQINYGYASYAFDKKNAGTFAVGMHYINYGKFDAADPTGTITGKFDAAEYALNLIYSHPIDSSFRWGLNIKPIYSKFESYNSLGIALDGGITYTSSDRLTTVAAVIRNLGSQLKSYAGTYEQLPFEILLGVSRKLQYAPFRFSITAQNLQRYKLIYDKNEDIDNELTMNIKNQSKFDKLIDNTLRHIIFGVEFLPSKSFYLAFAYNYKRRKEMALMEYPGSVGFSYGLGIHLKLFSISYGRAVYHTSGGSNHFSFLINFSQFYHR